MIPEIVLAVVVTAVVVTTGFIARDYLARKKAGVSSSGDLLELSERVSFDAGQLIWLIEANNRQISSLVDIVTNIATSSEDNASTTEEVSAGIEELSSITEEIHNRTGHIKEIFENVMANSVENRSWINKSGETLMDISGTIRDSAEAMDDLNNVVGKVNNLLGSIQGVTEEVNLLALNASIEAARAGEAGLGFTVVANEIKSLSNKTDKMTQEVRETINEVNNQLTVTGSAIGSGVDKITEVEEISRKSVQSFDETLQELEKVQDFIRQLSDNTEDQVRVTEQSTGAIHSISEESTDISNNIQDMSKIFGEQRKDSNEILDYSRNLNKVGYDLHKLSASQKKRNVLIFGVNPFTDPAKIKELYVPIIEEIGRRVGLKTRSVIVSDYEALADYIKNDLIDLGWFSPTAYVQAKKKADLKLLVTPVKKGTAFYKGVIITHKDSSYNSISDLKGCDFSFVDPLSTSGYIYPLQLIKNEGIDAHKDFNSVGFLGNHDNVIDAVLEKKVDAGATFNAALDMARNAGVKVDDLKLLAETEPIPNDAIAAKPSFSPVHAARLKKQFVTMGEESDEVKSLLAKAGIDGFQKVSDLAYDVVRRQQQ